MTDSRQDTAPTPHATLRDDYRPPAFLIATVDLHVALDPTATIVRARLGLRRAEPGAALRLDGEKLTLLSVTVDGTALDAGGYAIGPDGALTIPGLPDACVLETEVRIDPTANTELSGLYTSNGAYFTQCEAEGFRRITYFPDRPDVMSRYTVTLEADAVACPILLSNGNPGETGPLPGGRHFARWTDPHPKPCYLFALVAGDLVAVRDRFVTRSGRDVALNIWVRAGDEGSCGHAMESLKAAMAWDERVFGLEYDLDVYNIAAVSDFNMGAMENKGLNVFNTKYVLARPETATDGDFEGIETVIAHEYFHNWTGNRVTCRDWFQLSLKEGLTVFRDQEFSADQSSRAVRRIHAVRGLRAGQFPEDAGPLAHPVRPDSYIAIDNFYTATVYQKGAEVVRLLQTLIGPEAFRRGMALYIERHDNQAVTIEDFVAAMRDASGMDLGDFALWYEQAGTPALTVSDAYDPAARRYTLTLRQSTPPTPGQSEKRPMPIPVAMALLLPDGAEHQAPPLHVLRAAEEVLTFDGVAARPVPSLLRGFSAPVKLAGITPEQLGFLAAHDRDPFVRWDSGQTLATAAMLDLVAARARGAAMVFPDTLAAAARATLDDADRDSAFAAEALALPSESFVADQMQTVDPDGIHAARDYLRVELGRRLAEALAGTMDRLDDAGPYVPDGPAIGRRALRNMCLSYLGAAGADGLDRARQQFEAGRNMTDVLAALHVLAQTDDKARETALADFHARWRHDDLVLDKWFAIQATSSRPRTLDEVRALRAHPDFDLRNPNRVRALIGAFSGNQVRFHDASGGGYRFLADAIVELDPMNAQVAARMCGPLGQWRRQDAGRAALMRGELERILALPALSRLTFERVSKALA